MKPISFLLFLPILFSCSPDINQLQIFSPDKNIEVDFFTNEIGKAGYIVDFSNKRIIDTSYFSFDFQEALPFKENLEIIYSCTSSFDETWETVWGEQKYIRNNYNELKVELKEKGEKSRRCFIVFKVFDDGVGFRFEFPEQENLK
jgi:glucan 1,4-alpha-glucosidase